MSFERWLNGTLSLENAMPPSRSERYAVIETGARGAATTFRPGLSIVGERSNDDRQMREDCAARLRRGLASAHQVVLRDKHTSTRQIVAFVDVDHDTLQFLGNRMGKDGTADLVKRALRDDVEIRRRLDADLKDDHDRILRNLNLPRMPHSEMEWQWIRDIRRREKRETHLIKPLRLATRPTYYRGFIDDSYVDLWVRSPRAQSASLRFRGSEFEASIAIHIPQTDRARIGNGVYFAARPAQVRVWAALRLPPDENMFGRNVLLVSPDAWSDCRDPDVFDDIALDINTDGEVSIVAATVVLNDMVLSNFDYPQPIVAKQIRNASLKDSIAIGRLNALIRHPDELLPSNAADSRRPFTGILERPGIQLNPILVTAAMELGQAWHERYEAPWNYFYFDGSKHWMTAPRDWCSEFVLWCLRKSTNLSLDI